MGRFEVQGSISRIAGAWLAEIQGVSECSTKRPPAAHFLFGREGARALLRQLLAVLSRLLIVLV